MDCRAWPNRHRPALTVENDASPPHGAPPPISLEHPLVCCLSFALSSLPLCLFLTLSHRMTQWRHSQTTGHQLSFFPLQFSGSPFLSFSLYFLIFTALQLYSKSAICFCFILLLISLFHSKFFFSFFYLFQ